MCRAAKKVPIFDRIAWVPAEQLLQLVETNHSIVGSPRNAATLEADPVVLTNVPSGPSEAAAAELGAGACPPLLPAAITTATTRAMIAPVAIRV
jgi:hypothetical protein